MSLSFEIKSAQMPVMALVVKSADLREVTDQLLKLYGPDGDSAGFFEDDPLIIDLSRSSVDVLAVDLCALMHSLRACRLKPVAYRGLDARDEELALAQGLLLAPAELQRPVARPRDSEPVPAPVETVVREVEVIRETVREVVREVPAPSAMVMDKPVRSGQKIYARGADLVLLAMVNPGAEVAADGNIHVYAPLRGKAMAGASGNTAARIFSTCLDPELISIAGVYRTSEKPLPAQVQGKAAQVRLSDDGQEKLLFEPLAG